MSKRVLTCEEWGDQFRSYQRSAWRWERQPFYASDLATGWPERWLAGDRSAPMEFLGPWLAEVRQRRAAGKTMERVRVVDDPMTDIQRWADWAADFNRQAGEVILGLARPRARAVGLLDDAPTDFWLMDDQLVLLMAFSPSYELLSITADDDSATVGWACDIRDRARAAVGAELPRA